MKGFLPLARCANSVADRQSFSGTTTPLRPGSFSYGSPSTWVAIPIAAANFLAPAMAKLNRCQCWGGSPQHTLL
eukprot:12925363-Alexandrium_andersonii.AAC.1